MERKFKKQELKNKQVRQHVDGRISVFFTEGAQLHTIFLKSENLDREIVVKRIAEPKEIAPDAMYEWVYWEEV